MTVIQKIHTLYKAKGFKSFVLSMLRRIFNYKPAIIPLLVKVVSEGKGVEIGGPSSIFGDQGILPVYAKIPSLDNCNFKNNTLWNSDLYEGQSYAYHPTQNNGCQFVRDGIDLQCIQDETYDFLVSSHALEHIANPIKALIEWKRILRSQGYLILVLPCKEGNFDHKRPNTSLVHLLADYINNTQEDDLTHLDEILSLHDLSRDPWAGTFDTFKQRASDNFNNRSLHHHIFHPKMLSDLMKYLHMDIIKIATIDLTHIVVIAQKNPNLEAFGS
jgi:SAM-dependent methyltransferase